MKVSKYTSKEGIIIDVTIKDSDLLVSAVALSILFGGDFQGKKVYNLKEIIEIGNTIDRIKTIDFKIWANAQLSNKIEFGDAITKMANTPKKKL